MGMGGGVEQSIDRFIPTRPVKVVEVARIPIPRLLKAIPQRINAILQGRRRLPRVRKPTTVSEV